MHVVTLPIEGLLLVRPRVFRDSRGFFFESFSAPRYAEHGISDTFVQDNHSKSVKGTLRGLHYQSRPGQAKLVRCLRGRIWDVAVDIRPHSSSYGQHFGIELDDQKHEQLYVPIGFAHGFCVLSEEAEVHYKVSAPYEADTECTIQFDDSALAIPWPVKPSSLSERDRDGESFAAYSRRTQS